MVRRPVRIATTKQLERPVREAGFDTYLLPELSSLDFNRSLQQRPSDGPLHRPFLEKHDIDLVLDFNTSALTLVASESNPDQVALTTAELGIPYVACYLDPITSSMAQVDWADHWQLLESKGWIKWIPETTHSQELLRLGVPNIVTLPMAAGNDDFETRPLPDPDSGPVLALSNGGVASPRWRTPGDGQRGTGLLWHTHSLCRANSITDARVEVWLHGAYTAIERTRAAMWRGARWFGGSGERLL